MEVKKWQLPKVAARPNPLKRLRVPLLQFATFCNSELTHLCSAPPLFYGVIEDDLRKQLVNQKHDNESMEVNLINNPSTLIVFFVDDFVFVLLAIHILKVGI